MKNKDFDRDFFPYVNNFNYTFTEYKFWTGYFSSRP